MAIIAPKMSNNNDFELTPAGNHMARLFKIINIGTIDSGFQNADGTPKYQPKVRLYFELSNKLKTYKDVDMNEVTKPFAISKEVTLSMFKSQQVAKLRTIAEAMIGTSLKDEEAETFDVESLIGMPCMVQVTHEQTKDGNTFAKLTTVTSVPEGIIVPPLVNEKEIVDVNTASLEAIEALPDFIKDKMKTSKEYEKRFTK
jgi:hypothetical protein